MQITEAINNNTPPDDSFLRDVYSVIVNQMDYENIKYALELHMTPPYRDTIMAFFLSWATLEQVGQGTGIALDVLSIFEKLFIDRAVFRNKLEWKSYVLFYADKCCHDDAGRDQVMKGATEGPLSLLQHWRVGNESLFPSKWDLVSDFIMIAYEKAIIARNSSILSEAAKEAYKWSALTLKTLQVQEGLKDIRHGALEAHTAIEQRESTLKVTDLGIQPADIAH